MRPKAPHSRLYQYYFVNLQHWTLFFGPTALAWGGLRADRHAGNIFQHDIHESFKHTPIHRGFAGIRRIAADFTEENRWQSVTLLQKAADVRK